MLSIKREKMRSVKLKAAVLLCIASMFVFCSCASESACDAEIVRQFNVETLDGVTESGDNIVISSGENQSICLDYTVSGGNPNELCSVKLRFKAEGENENLLSVNTEERFDINGSRTTSIVKSNGNYGEITHILKLNSNGESGFSVSLNTKSDYFGKIELEPLKILNISEDNDLDVIESKDKSVSFIAYKSDFSESAVTYEKCSELTEQLANMRASLEKFTGDNENKNVQYVFTENVSHTGLSGELIYIDNAQMFSLFENTEDKNAINKESLISVLCHEMSHKFDEFDSQGNSSEYCFDKEFFAILKEMYALYDCGFDIDEDFLGSTNYLAKGIYNYQDFLNRFLSALDVFESPKNWSFVSKVITDLRSINDEMSEGEKMMGFIEHTSDVSGIDISRLLGESEWQTVCEHFNLSGN